jgi:thioredoxin 1
MRNSWRIFPIPIFLLLVLLISCSGSSEKSAESKNQEGQIAVAAEKTVSLPKMLDLGSTVCIPCKQMAPILDSLKTQYAGKVEINFIDVREDKALARKYGITMIPTQIFFDTLGNEVNRHIGFFPADSITARLQNLGAKL